MVSIKQTEKISLGCESDGEQIHTKFVSRAIDRGMGTRNIYAGRAGKAAAPSALIHGGQQGQELHFILNSFHLSYSLNGHFPEL